jgi:hypothetical protein
MRQIRVKLENVKKIRLTLEQERLVDDLISREGVIVNQIGINHPNILVAENLGRFVPDMLIFPTGEYRIKEVAGYCFEKNGPDHYDLVKGERPNTIRVQKTGLLKRI